MFDILGILRGLGLGLAVFTAAFIYLRHLKRMFESQVLDIHARAMLVAKGVVIPTTIAGVYVAIAFLTLINGLILISVGLLTSLLTYVLYHNYEHTYVKRILKHEVDIAQSKDSGDLEASKTIRQKQAALRKALPGNVMELEHIEFFSE